ncbi:MAG: pyridoxamine 5'-phosphate oxidase family protein [Pseudomonadota bacterium]
MTNPFDNPHTINSSEQLREIYGEPSRRSLTKELDHLSEPYQALVRASGFVLVASVGPEGLDISPRGDAPGFVRIHDERTLLLPDRRGNNRADTLNNLVRDNRISLIFLIPGVGETLRVNGRAKVVIDDELCDSFTVAGKAPRSVLVTRIERTYFQCQKAIVRSALWSQESVVARATLPTAGEMIADSDASFDHQSYDAGYADYMKETLY